MLKFRVFKDSADEWRWNLHTHNGSIVADSGEGYKNKKDCYAAIDTIKHGVCADTPIEECEII